MRWTEDDLDGALRDLREEEPPVAAMAGVRSRVRERLERRRAWMPWGWLAAAAAVIVLMVANPEQTPVGGLQVTVAAPVVPQDAFRRSGLPAAHKAVARRRHEVTASREFIHLMTDDPDVVILWAVESKGDTE